MHHKNADEDQDNCSTWSHNLQSLTSRNHRVVLRLHDTGTPIQLIRGTHSKMPTSTQGFYQRLQIRYSVTDSRCQFHFKMNPSRSKDPDPQIESYCTIAASWKVIRSQVGISANLNANTKLLQTWENHTRMEKPAGMKFWCYKPMIDSSRKNVYHADHTLIDLQSASAHHVLLYPQLASSSVPQHRCTGTVQSGT